MTEPRILLVYTDDDRSEAELLTSLLNHEGITHTGLAPPPGTTWTSWATDAASTATHALVLVGPKTRMSRWVDREIELSTECRETGPGAALIGIILPTHEDFDRPYYDPEHVPVRLHDLVQRDYAMIRKWSENGEEIRRWLDEADKRRYHARPEPSLAAAAKLYRFSWDATVDRPRGNLETK